MMFNKYVYIYYSDILIYFIVGLILLTNVFHVSRLCACCFSSCQVVVVGASISRSPSVLFLYMCWTALCTSLVLCSRSMCPNH